jgi:transposase-like protein
MIPHCPSAACIRKNAGPFSRPVIRHGFFRRSSDSRRVRRFRCLECGRTFSRATRSACFGQRRRRLNEPLRVLICSGVSQRRAARILGANRKTIVRKFRFLAARARIQNELDRHRVRPPVRELEFDDLETSEHSKCKPLSVALAVDPKTREILSFKVSQMPAKGHLAGISRQKYGPRKDERPAGWNALHLELKPLLAPGVIIRSDENPHYARFIRRHHPAAIHQTVKGRRGCVAGQGELKKIGFDPIFSLNHTCAMLRANLNRLFRRTWCTTKNRQGLRDHLDIYVQFHNRELIRGGPTG